MFYYHSKLIPHSKEQEAPLSTIHGHLTDDLIKALHDSKI